MKREYIKNLEKRVRVEPTLPYILIADGENYRDYEGNIVFTKSEYPEYCKEHDRVPLVISRDTWIPDSN